MSTQSPATLESMDPDGWEVMSLLPSVGTSAFDKLVSEDLHFISGFMMAF